MGAETAFSEKTPVTDYVQVFRDFADAGYNVIVGHGFQFGDVAMEVAPDYPDIKFIVTLNTLVSADNIAGIAAAAWEPAYLLGMLAAMMSETDQIGGIAGYDFPNIVSQMEAYKLGAREVNPDIEATIVYIGTMEDVAKAKEAALAQASAGVDVIFHIADAAGLGVIQAAEETDTWVVGWGADQNHLAPDNVLSSSLTNTGGLLIKDVEQITRGTWTGGVRVYGIDTGIVDIADFHGLVPEDIAAAIAEARQEIIDGELEIPYIPEMSD
jgi:basic membrane protein A